VANGKAAIFYSITPAVRRREENKTLSKMNQQKQAIACKATADILQRKKTIFLNDTGQKKTSRSRKKKPF